MVMVTLTGLLSSPKGGAWLVVAGMGVALMGEEVRVEAARGNAVAGPGKRQTSKTIVGILFCFSTKLIMREK